MKNAKAIPTIAGAILRTFLLVLAWWFAIPWLLAVTFVSDEAISEKTSFSDLALLNSIEKRIRNDRAEGMDAIFPEGELFAYSFYGISLINVALADPENVKFHEHAIARLEPLIAQVGLIGAGNKFSWNDHDRSVESVISQGQANLLRAGYAILGGNDEDTIAAFHAESLKLMEAFREREVPVLESYQGMYWPVDNCMALESLRLHDVLFGTNYNDFAGKRWAEWMAVHLDRESGMMVAQLNYRGDVLDGPRGCALSWSLAFMTGFAPELAAAQYEQYRKLWFVPVKGMAGFREFPPGVKGWMDADTGPIVMGIGAAASAFGIGAARANGDLENYTRMLRGLELLGFSLWMPNGKSYFLGQVLLADEIALLGKTNRRWDLPAGAQVFASKNSLPLNNFLSVLVPLWLITVAILLISLWSVVSYWRGITHPAEGWSKTEKILPLLQIALIVVFLLVPGIGKLITLVVMGFLDFATRKG